MMARKSSPPVARKPRADALRNRERILAVAKKAFTRSGANASLDEIAKQAEVGPGTLYRHFPTRDDLLAAVYRSEVEKLGEAQARFSASMRPIDALREWLLLFVDYIAAKKIIAPALETIVGGPSRLYENTTGVLTGAINTLVQRAVESGDVLPNTDPMDLLRAVYGVSSVAPDVDWTASARRMVDILIRGVRP
ncbi:TetR/AcrR family transcriptional regulator [Terriglobus sp. 2YAB30_2]|uniref:TetR/AcrR family transcriptional regulator n=1 Tax=unclassified Terriglobus TaxID=2628988 RepID=UPI003F9E47BE